MQKWNIATDRAQNANDKNGVISLVIMFTSRVMVIKIPIVAHVLYIVLWQHKISHTLGKIFKCIWKILLSSFRKCSFRKPINGFWATITKMSTLENTGFRYFFADSVVFFYISTLNISQTITTKPVNHTIFWKNLIRLFRCT